MFKEEKKVKQYRAYLKHCGPLVQIQCGHHQFEDFSIYLQYMDKEKVSFA